MKGSPGLWIADVRTERGCDVIMLLLGSKMDLANKRQTTTEEGKQHTKELSTMITEKSAQTGCNMKQLFRPSFAWNGKCPGEKQRKDGQYQARQTPGAPGQREWLLPLMQPDLPLALLICCDLGCVLQALPSHPPASPATLQPALQPWHRPFLAG